MKWRHENNIILLFFLKDVQRIESTASYFYGLLNFMYLVNLHAYLRVWLIEITRVMKGAVTKAWNTHSPLHKTPHKSLACRIYISARSMGRHSVSTAAATVVKNGPEHPVSLLLMFLSSASRLSWVYSTDRMVCPTPTPFHAFHYVNNKHMMTLFSLISIVNILYVTLLIDVYNKRIVCNTLNWCL